MCASGPRELHLDLLVGPAEPAGSCEIRVAPPTAELAPQDGAPSACWLDRSLLRRGMRRT